MINVIDYDGSPGERVRISTEQSLEGFNLVEVQDHKDGHHLVFDDGQPVRTVEERFKDLETRVKNIETKEVPV